MDIEKYRRLFVEEASEHLSEMARALAALESRQEGDAEGSIDTLFRMAHSIKGMASSLDYDSVASLAHRLEDWLEPLRRAGEVPDGALPVLYDVLAALEQMVASVEETGSAPPTRGDVLAKLAEPGEFAQQAPVPAPDEEAGARKKGRSSARRRCRARSASGRRPSIAFWPPSVS